jgi:shikimate kinase / 3-dehydroquinate synthase
LSRDPRRLLLWGPPAVGKTTVGRALARALGGAFADLDDLVSERHGLPRADLFVRGEPTFRELERRELERLLEPRADPSSWEVLALGGGALVDDELRAFAARSALLIGLHAPLDVLVERAAGGSRPLLRAGDPTETLRRLAEGRPYLDTHLTLSTTRPPEELAAELAASLNAARVFPLSVAHAPNYATLLGDASTLQASLAARIAAARPSQLAVVTDSNVGPLHLTSFLASLRAASDRPVHTFVRPAGEEHKTFASLERLLHDFAEVELDRSSLVIALGGGVTSDVTGLACALHARGLSWIAVPTSLMAMADAAVGGKTAVNLGPSKNGVGTFHHPRAVLVDPTYSSTESARAVKSGLAEIVKCAAIADGALFRWLEDHTDALVARDPAALAHALTGAIAVKSRLVEEDPRESGARRLLNFGHTFGHALEAAADYRDVLHGEAVAIGMRVAVHLGLDLGVTPRSAVDSLGALLQALNLPTSAPQSWVSPAFAHLGRDKKREGGTIRFVLLEEIGRACTQPLPLEGLADRIERAALAARDALPQNGSNCIQVTPTRR